MISNNKALGGYAPGSYSCTCCECKKEFFGDKRAVQCYDCAVEADVAKEKEIAEIAQRIRDEYRKHNDIDWSHIAARKIYDTMLYKRNSELVEKVMRRLRMQIVLPAQLNIHVLNNTVFIDSGNPKADDAFNFMFTPADAVVKPEFEGQYRNFGGIQHNLPQESEEAQKLESSLCDLAEAILTSLNRMPVKKSQSNVCDKCGGSVLRKNAKACPTDKKLYCEKCLNLKNY